MRLDVEADPSTIGQLGMATSAHQLASMGIRLALQEQLSNSALQRIDFGKVGLSGLGGDGYQLDHIALDSLGKLDLDLGSGFAH